MPSLDIEDPLGTGSLDLGAGTANQHRQAGTPPVLLPGQSAVTIDGFGPLLASILSASTPAAAP